MEPFIGENMHIFMLNAYRMRWPHIPITKINHFGNLNKTEKILDWIGSIFDTFSSVENNNKHT